MPSSVANVFSGAGLETQGAVRWGSPPYEKGPGVYVVALSAETRARTPTIDTCPVDLWATKTLLGLRPELLLDGRRPTIHELCERVSGFWLPDEVVLYIGLAGTSVRKRVGQYYRTPLGAQKPHAGGWFLKLLSCLNDLTVHFAASHDPDSAESRMIEAFCRGVSEATRTTLVDPDHPFPFANIEWPRGTRKRHGILGAKGEVGSPPGGPKGPTPRAPRETPNARASVDIGAISDCIQQQLRARGMDEVAAVEAASWLDKTGLLKDSLHRPGLPLRNLLRQGRILGQRQESNHRWFIDRIA